MKSHSLLRNITANTAGYFVMLGLAFVTFPVLLKRLGAARYGVWMLVSEVTGYYSYVGLGIRAGVTYFAGRYVAQEKPTEMSEIVSTSVWSLAVAGVLLGFSSFALAAYFPRIFPSPELDPYETYWAIVLAAFAVAISLPVEALNSTLTAAKRLDAVNLIDMVSRILSSAGILVAVLCGHGLVALALIQLAFRIATVPATFAATRRVLPELSFSIRHWKAHRLKELARFGLPAVLIGLGWLISSRTDLVVVGAAMGVSMVTYYAIPRSLMEYADTGVRAIAWSFTSHLTHLHARGESELTVELYLKGARISGLIVCVLTGLILIFGKPFLTVWQGSAFVSAGPRWNQPGAVLSVLTIAFLPRLLHNMASQLSYATNRLDFFMWIALLEGAVKVALSLWLWRPYGLVGVAVSNLIPMFLFEGLAVLIYLFRTFPFSLGSYAREALGKPLVAGAAALGVGAALARIQEPDNWPFLIAEASIAAVVGFATAVACGTTSAERQSLLHFLMISDEPAES